MRGVNERSLRYLVLHHATDLADRQQHTEIRTKVQYSNCSIQLDPFRNVIPITGLPNVHAQHDGLPQSLERNTGLKASSSLLLSSEVFYFFGYAVFIIAVGLSYMYNSPALPGCLAGKGIALY